MGAFSIHSTSSLRASAVEKVNTLVDSLKTIKTTLGNLVDLTPAVNFLNKAEASFDKFMDANYVTRNPLSFLAVAIRINNVVKLIFEPIFSAVSDGLSYVTDALSILNLFSIKDIYKELRTMPAAFKTAEKTSEKAKIILGGVATSGKVFSLADSLTKTIGALTDTIKTGANLAKLAPSLAAIGLIFSTAATAVKIWDLKETYQFGKKIKEQCCQKLMIEMGNDLKNRLKNSDLEGKDELLKKIDHAIKISHKTTEKSLYKSIQKELTKVPLNYTELSHLLDNVPVFEGPLHDLKNGVHQFNELSQASKLLRDPTFIKSCQEKTSLLLDVALDDLKNLDKTGPDVNFKTLKKELKQAAASIDHELLASIDRSSKLAYLDVLAHYNQKTVGKAYQLKGADLQGSAKKVTVHYEKLRAEGNFSKADEMLTSHHRELKGRISYKKTTDVLALGLNAVGMASSAIGIAISFGALGTPAAPAGIVLGAVASALGIALTYAKYKQNSKSEENLGITESKHQVEWQNKLEALNLPDDLFLKNLNPGQQKLLESIRQKMDSADFDTLLYYRFNLPKVDPNASFEEKAKQTEALETAMGLNDLIVSMNKWAKKKPLIQERNLDKHLAHQLKKIDFNQVPETAKEIFITVQDKIRNKQYHTKELELLRLEENWTPEQKAAVANTNSLILSMNRGYQTRMGIKISNLTKRCDILPLLLKNAYNLTDENVLKLINGEELCTSPQMQQRVNSLKAEFAKLANLKQEYAHFIS